MASIDLMAITMSLKDFGFFAVLIFLAGAITPSIFYVVQRVDYRRLEKDKYRVENLYRQQTSINLEINEKLLSQLTKLINNIDLLREDKGNS
jgi:uncharacterized membrane protein (DUF106 family)